MVIDQTVINIGKNSGSPTTLYENTGSTDVIINNLLTVSKYNDFPTSETEKLTASDGASNDYYGSSVSISADGSTVAIGSKYNDDTASNSGSVYVYKYNSETSSWDETKINASDPASSDEFGGFIDLNSRGDKIIIGARYDDDNGPDSGSAYVFTYNSGTDSWDETKLTASDGAAGDQFGKSVAISGDGNTVAIGAHLDDDNSSNESGSVYVYKYNSGADSWDETKLTASDPGSSDYFGWSVSMSEDGNSIITGANYDNVNTSSGSAYIFTYNSSTETWSEEEKLVPSDATTNNQFGWSVSMSADGNSVIVGALFNDENGIQSGSAYIYKYNSGTSSWDETKIIASDGTNDDQFTISVSMSADGNSVIVGAYYDDDTATSSGSAYIYKYNSGTSSWDETKLNASDASSLAQFGWSVSMSADGNSVIVGAIGDNGAIGSAYIFQSSDNDITIIKEDANANDYTIINQSYSNKSNQIITKDNKVILKPNEKIKGYGSSPNSNVVITTIVQE